MVIIELIDQGGIRPLQDDDSLVQTKVVVME